MIANRRIFWMLASSFMALIFSHFSPLVSVFFVLTSAIWISHNAMVLTVEGRTE